MTILTQSTIDRLNAERPPGAGGVVVVMLDGRDVGREMARLVRELVREHRGPRQPAGVAGLVDPFGRR